MGADGVTEWTATFAAPASDLLEARVSDDGARVLLSLYAGATTEQMPAGFAVYDSAGKVVFEPDSPPFGVIAAVDATPDLRRVIASHAKLSGDEAIPPAGVVRGYLDGAPAWSLESSASYVIASASPDGGSVALLEGRRYVSLRPWGSAADTWRVDLESVQSLRFTQDGSRILASDYRSEQSNSDAATYVSRFRLLDATTGGILWDDTFRAEAFFLPAMDRSGARIAVMPIEPGTPAYVCSTARAGASRDPLPDGAVSACLLDDAILLGFADGTVGKYTLPR
jgi:hypothetical protein